MTPILELIRSNEEHASGGSAMNGFANWVFT